MLESFDQHLGGAAGMHRRKTAQATPTVPSVMYCALGKSNPQPQPCRQVRVTDKEFSDIVF